MQSARFFPVVFSCAGWIQSCTFYELHPHTNIVCEKYDLDRILTNNNPCPANIPNQDTIVIFTNFQLAWEKEIYFWYLIDLFGKDHGMAYQYFLLRMSFHQR